MFLCVVEIIVMLFFWFSFPATVLIRMIKFLLITYEIHLVEMFFFNSHASHPNLSDTLAPLNNTVSSSRPMHTKRFFLNAGKILDLARVQELCKYVLFLKIVESLKLENKK